MVAYTGGGLAWLFDSKLRPIHCSEQPYISDAHFSPDGALVTFGDWSAGRVLAIDLGADKCGK